MGLEERVGELPEGRKRNIWYTFLRRRVTPHVMKALSDIADLDDTSGYAHRQLYFRFLKEHKAKPWSRETITAFLEFLEKLKKKYLKFIVSEDIDWKLEDIWGIIDRARTRSMNTAKENARRGYLLYKAYVNSNYLRGTSGRYLSLPAISTSLDVLLDHQPPIDGVALGTVLSAGRAHDLDEAVECALITIPNYLLIKRLGSGTIKKAYLARNIHSGDESAFLMIDPTSKGFAHYETIFRRQLEKQGVHMTDGEFREWTLQKLYAAEFSGVRLRDLEDPRYISLISPPIVGKDEHGKDVYFLEAKPYDHTLEDELREGPLKERKLGATQDEYEQRRYTYHMALALRNCHKAGIVHKDLKPDNIGITKEGNVVLSDFGCVSMFSTAGDTRYQYPVILRPPELAYPDNYWQGHDVWWQSDLFTPEANIWTLGMILYRMATGKNLIEGPEQRAKQDSEEYHRQNAAIYSQIHHFSMIQEKIRQVKDDDLRRMITWCLKENPSERKGVLDDIVVHIAEEDIFLQRGQSLRLENEHDNEAG
ncbi:protein kinase [Candidatus Woesearchaeota archaeon]|nr:protein kinase [Candidatus Woesearchaeota archaeon]